MVTIKEVSSKKDLDAFIKFPFKIYKNHPYWVPPIISQETETFNQKKNPIFKDAEARLYLAYNNGELVGRIAGIINHLELNELKQKKMRFGWFDFIDDLEVSKALLETVEKYGKSRNLEYCEGPVGFSNLDKVGVITEGFDAIAPMITWYNHPYYVKHYEFHGYLKEKGFLENKFSFSNVDGSMFAKAQELIKRRYGLKSVTFNNTKEIMPYVDQMFDLFNTSYAALSSFVKITDIQKAYFKKKFVSFVNPEYVKFVVDQNNKLIAFAIVMPSFAEALQKINGKLFPLGFMQILKAKKHSKKVIFYLIGILPEFQNKGVTAIIFDEYYKTFNEKGIETCIRTPELEDNSAIHQLWKHFNPEIYRKRQTMRKYL